MATAPQPKIDKDGFFIQLDFAARTFGANRDYLYAVAIVESGVQNIQSAAARGPFQFLPSTWKALVAKSGAETGVTEADITDPAAQALFAAIYAGNAQQALATALGRDPTGAQLYLTHLLGSAGATAELAAGVEQPVDSLGSARASAVLSAGEEQPIDVALRVFYKATALGEGFADKVLAAKSDLLLKDGKARPTKEVLDTIVTKLNPALAEAAALAARLMAAVVDPAALANADARIRGTIDAAKTAFTRLRVAGWSKEQVCGILANILAESSFNHKNITGDGGNAHGLCQWHEDRRQIFEDNFHKPFALSTFDDQVDFITFEMNHKEKPAGDLLKNATTPADAARIVCSDYERPADKVGDSNKRIPLAEAYARVFQ